MSESKTKRIGLIVGSETSFPTAFIDAVNQQNKNVIADFVKIDRITIDDVVPYDVIIDRMSHNVPFYRAYLKFAALAGCYVVNNPFTRSADDKFFGMALLQKLGVQMPRSLILPNKSVSIETTPDSFRNLNYPMDWDAIIDYVGVPAIFKEANTGGRSNVFRVSNVDELIDRYDGSGIMTMILQEIIEAEHHIHCFVVGEETMLVEYVVAEDKYNMTPTDLTAEQKAQISKLAVSISQAYEYEVNMVEHVVRDGQIVVINPVNPAPQVTAEMLPAEAFSWFVESLANLAIELAVNPKTQKGHVNWREITDI
jgi:glutathione synthase/RimK-type ligase-like ATP-grasp enzyme